MQHALSCAKTLMNQESTSVADRLMESILDKIATGQWPVGYTLPSEKDLIEAFGISRIAVRECILKLRALGILKASRGKRTVVAKIDSRLIGCLFPLILANEGPQAFEHVFELRLMIESHSAAQAARRLDSTGQAALLEALEGMQGAGVGETDTWIDWDKTLHLRIAQASQNPLYPLLTEALWGFLHTIHPVIHRDCAERRGIDEHYHRAIVEAITLGNADRARVEMEAHLQSSADYIRHSGVLHALTPPQP